MLDYKERFVAFIDILGFEALIEQSLGPDRSITPDAIKEALEVPNPAESERIDIGRIGGLAESGHRMTVFSDCIAITVHPTEFGLLHLLHHVAKIGFRLIRLKTPILCRGGITLGPVYHDGQVIFGPALAEARTLEKERARFPRVILSAEVNRTVLAAQPPINKMLERFIRLDEGDGAYFVNTLRELRMAMAYEEKLPAEISAICDHIAQYLRRERSRLSGEELEQILWFQKYFDWATDRSVWGYSKQPLPQPLD